jgi:formylglycine-generating enzyme required for sulfatase activity/energy-coupling factor transporter ATP-binding protein EcfA2
MADETLYHVFLSHNSADKPAVEVIARRLCDEAGLALWLEAWDMVPGTPKQEAQEAALTASACCAVLIGAAGLSGWQNEQMRAAIQTRVEDDSDFRVIPVLLPGAELPERGGLPPFLRRYAWVDFRPGLDDPHAFDRLVCGIKGIAPGEGERPAEEALCPYLGLRPFQEEHAPYFFGRGALTQWLVEDLRDGNFLTIIGPSGSGKSSLARAGLVAALRQGALPGSDQWPMRIVTPGPEPVSALASALVPLLNPPDPVATRHSLTERLRADPQELTRVVGQILSEGASAGSIDTRLLLLVDQFEEIFTLCHDESERAAFIAALLDATRPERRGLAAVLTMRADFYSRAASYPNLAARLERRQRVVSPLDEADLRQAVEEPARVVGLHFEKGLVDIILKDAGLEPGALPLVQHTLWELWGRRRGDWLTFDAYGEIGGVQGALAHRAEEVYAAFTQEERKVTRRALLRLTQPGEGTEDTRRRASKEELIRDPAQAEVVEDAVHKLANARLLTTARDQETGQEVVDVAHEALIQGWPRLQGWVNEDRAGLLIHRRLTEAATEWEKNERDESYLYRGTRLAEAEEWVEAHVDDLNQLEQAFMTVSREAKEREQRAARMRRVGIAAVAVMATAIVAAVTTLGITGQLNRLLYPPLPMEWATVPTGEFLMGSSDAEINSVRKTCPSCYVDNEKPQHVVYLDSYEINRYEVTKKEYHQCVLAGVCNIPNDPFYDKPDYQDHPVVSVDWEDANKFCEWLGGRLPTEAEWEKAARSTEGSTRSRVYPWGDEWDPQKANVERSDDGGTLPVGSFSPAGDSTYGVSDLAGNVWEWTADWYSEGYYRESPAINPVGPSSGTYRILRGGSFVDSRVDARSAYRAEFNPNNASEDIGFRCARDTSHGIIGRETGGAQ